MTLRPLTLAMVAALSIALSACDGLASRTEQEYIQRAKDFEDAGNTRGSIIELKNALQKNPQSAEARLMLGRTYLREGMGAEAEKELSHAGRLGVGQDTIKPLRAEALMLMGEYRRLLDEVAVSDTGTPALRARVLQLRGEAMFRLGEREQGCAMQSQARDTDPALVSAYWGLAQCAVAQRDMQKAKQWLDQALTLGDRRARTFVFLGDWHRLNGETDAALRAYNEALRAEPDNLEALQNRTLLNISRGQPELARKDVEKVRSLAPKSAGALYLQALLHFNEKQYTEAREALQNSLRAAPDNMPAVLLAGVNAYVLESYQQAESHLQKFLAQYPAHAYARRALAATFIKQSHYDRALETLAPQLDPGSKDVAALTLAGDAYLLKGDSGRASQLFERAAAIDPRNAAVRTQLGLSQLVSGNGHLAVSALEVAASLDPKQSHADSLLALTYLERKQYDKALEAIAAMEKKMPASPVPHGLRGDAYLGKGDRARARASFERAVSLDAGFFPAADRLASLDLQDKQPARAAQRFKTVLAHNKNDLQAMLALAQLAAILRDTRESVAWLEKAARAHPTAIRPRQLLVTYLIGAKQPQKALAYAREAADANPEAADALDLLGVAQEAAGERANAMSTYTRLTEKYPQRAEAWYRLAMLQSEAEQRSAARSSLMKALAADPNHMPAFDALLEVEAKAGNLNRALELARGLQAKQPRNAHGWVREGDLLSGAGRYAEAIRAYDKAGAIAMTTPLAIKTHRALAQLGKTEAADAGLREWLRAHPADFPALSYLAQTQMHSGKTSEAIQTYEAVLKLAPRDVPALNNLAVLYQQRNDPRALALAKRAYETGGKHPAIADTYGWALVNNGQAARGLPLLKEAVAAAPQEPSVRYHHAVALSKLGRRDAAAKELQHALGLRGNFPEREAAQALARSLQR